jgi:hypothetical protein
MAPERVPLPAFAGLFFVSETAIQIMGGEERLVKQIVSRYVAMKT